MKYNPALDGLRALACFSVVLVHCGVPWFHRGAVGVEVFFVLSGYLITSILLAEHCATGVIKLGRFYWRRALRLWPPLLLMLLVYALAAPRIWPGHPHMEDVALAGLYLSDYSLTFFKRPEFMGHTWSLSAEEHFYLVWPLVLMALLRTKHPERWLCGLLGLAYAWYFVHHLSGTVDFRFDTRATGLIAGCALAFAMRRGLRVNSAIAGWSGMALFTALVLPLLHSPLPFSALAGVLLILGASALPLSSAPLAWVGRLSYGIYLWHYPIAMALAVSWPLRVAATAVLATFAAWVSYATVEAVARRYRSSKAPRTQDSYQPA